MNQIRYTIKIAVSHIPFAAREATVSPTSEANLGCRDRVDVRAEQSLSLSLCSPSGTAECQLWKYDMQ